MHLRSSSRQQPRREIKDLPYLGASKERTTEYRDRLILELREALVGRKILVFGGQKPHRNVTEWERQLGVKVEWLPSSPDHPADQKRVLASDPASTVLVLVWTHMPHLKAKMKEWIRANDVAHQWVSDGSEWSVLERLRGLLLSRQA